MCLFRFTVRGRGPSTAGIGHDRNCPCARSSRPASVWDPRAVSSGLPSWPRHLQSCLLRPACQGLLAWRWRQASSSPGSFRIASARAPSTTCRYRMVVASDRCPIRCLTVSLRLSTSGQASRSQGWHSPGPPPTPVASHLELGDVRFQGPFETNHGVDHGILDLWPLRLIIAVAAHLDRLPYALGPRGFRAVPF